MTNEIRFEVDCEAEVTDFHSEMEILYVLSGRTAVMVNGTNFVLQSEDFIVFNPWEHHALYRENGSHTLSLYILSSYISDNRIGQLRCCSHIDKEHQEYLGLIRSKLALLFKAYNAPDENRMYILSQLFGLLAILKQEFESNNETEINFSREKDNIRKAFQYIETHYKEKLSLQEVADHVYLSRSYLSKEFQKSAGVSFADHLRTLRLNEAMKLLRNSEKSINEIALESGFSNIKIFYVHNFLFLKLYQYLATKRDTCSLFKMSKYILYKALDLLSLKFLILWCKYYTVRHALLIRRKLYALVNIKQTDLFYVFVCLADAVLYIAAADVFVHHKCQVTFLLLEFGDRLEGAFFAVPSGELF